MKKIFAGILTAAFITAPTTALALEPMSRDALKKTTAQAGVSIFFDHVVILIKSQPTVTYWDTDGTTSYQGTVGNVRSAGIRIEYNGKKSSGQK